MFVKWHRVSAAGNITAINGNTEVCLEGFVFFFNILLSLQSPACSQYLENIFCYLTLANIILPQMNCIFLSLSIFFNSSLQMIYLLHCNSPLTKSDSHPEVALYCFSNVKLLNCQCGIKETWALKGMFFHVSRIFSIFYRSTKCFCKIIIIKKPNSPI